MSKARPEPPARPHDVRSFVRRFHREILDAWTAAARDLPVARQLSQAGLIDHIPDLLEEIAAIADEEPSGADVQLTKRHALERLAEGFDVTTIVTELSLLRAAVLTVWEQHAADGSMAQARALNLALDRAIALSVARYTQANLRTLTGIDRISTASFAASSVTDFLQRLLAVFMETTPTAGVGAILIAEGERLHLRAAVGLDEELARNASLAIGEGFAGTIARTCKPMALDSASTSPLLGQSLIREKGVRGFYGIPLVHEAHAIGVAFMGSRTNREFSEEDRRFFNSLGARATVGLVQHMLRRELVASEQRLQAMAEVRERDLARLEALLAASPAGIAFLDRDLRYISANEAIARINRRPRGEHLGRTVREILPVQAPFVEPLLRRVLETGQPLINLEAGDADLVYLINYFPILAPAGDIVGVGGVVLDITERKMMEEQLRLAVRSRDEMMAVVSHDLRSPLGTIQLAAGTLLAQLGDEPRQRRLLEMITRAGGRMDHLINDLLDTASIRAGRLDLDLRIERAEQIAVEACEVHQPLAVEKGIQLTTRLGLGTATIRADRDRLLQVFANLIGNALKFCRAGDRITIGGELAGSEVRFSVSDSGPGIPPDIVPRLFDAYVSGTEHRKHGAGLGLYICRGIVESHGGRIWVESTHGRGATFSFTVPAIALPV